ncbi:methylation-associated defense system AAA family ATPase MAD3 [Deferrisoma palaeochoriense]
MTRIEALGYRSLRYVTAELRPFQLLVGPNASGKSTFLDVIGLLGDLVRTDLDTAIRGDSRLEIMMRAPDPSHLTWLRGGDAFELAVELAIPPQVQTAKGRAYRTVRYEVRVEVTGEPRVAAENVWLVGENGQETEGVTQTPAQPTLFPAAREAPDHIVRLPRKKSPKGWKKVVSRGDAGQSYFISETTGWNAPFALSSQKTALASLPEDRDRFPVALWFRDVLQTGVQRLALSAEAMRRPSPPTRQAGYLPDGSNLPYVVARLEERHPDRLKRWVAHLREALPDIEGVTTAEREEDRHRYLVVCYRNGLKAPSWLVSDGTLRTLALTLLAYTPDVDGGILLIEEPENGIHPRAIETVFQALSSVYGAQIFLATHSPVVLGMAELDDLLCFGRTEEGATDIVAGCDHPRVKQWKGSLDVSSLFAAGVLG